VLYIFFNQCSSNAVRYFKLLNNP